MDKVMKAQRYFITMVTANEAVICCFILVIITVVSKIRKRLQGRNLRFVHIILRLLWRRQEMMTLKVDVVFKELR